MSEHEEFTAAGATMTGDPMPAADRPVVVGVDGSLRDQSAVEWAAEEAERAHRGLWIVAGTGEFAQPRVGVNSDLVVSYDDDPRFEPLMRYIANRVRNGHPSVAVSPSVRRGEPSACLAELSRRASVVVVGSRGLGAVRRAAFGSTSIATAGRTSCPTVVVPDRWVQRTHAGEPVLVGLDLEHDSAAILDYAFDRARRMGVPLVAAHVWEAHSLAPPRKDDSVRRAVEVKHAVDGVLRPWRAAYPDVEAVAHQIRDRAARGLLGAGEHAQLLVLGRTSSAARLMGLPLGSVARAVLHDAERPVAVIPSL
jgi:nucleotide-binding universal stress UspA family protein